jgi:UDPglucose 6-dehydrogenase
MTIGIIGSGRLGLAFGLLCEKAGYKVILSDLNQDYIYNINKKICLTNEPFIQQMLFESKNITGTTNNLEVIEQSDIIFTFVDTPTTIDGNNDTTNLFKVVDDFLKAFNNDITIYGKKFIVGCSTNPGDCDKVQQILEPYVVEVAYSPKFVSKGELVKGIKESDIILIGSKYPTVSENLLTILRKIQTPPIRSYSMSLLASEITKFAINSFIATKVSFANMIGEVLIKSGLSDEIDIVLSAIGGNSFIGNKYLKYGFGYGGPYLPKDSRFLSSVVEEVAGDSNILKSVEEANVKHARFLKNFFILKNPNKNIPFILESLTYKKGTDDLEESQRYQLCIDLLEEGYYVYVVDDNLLFKKLKYISEQYDNRLRFYKTSDSIDGFKINL